MKRIILAAALAVVATLALAATASADVTRYQTGTLTVVVLGTYTHVYDITTCGVNFTGTGGIAALNLGEEISGTLDGQTLHFTANYVSGYNVGYSYTDASYPMAWSTANMTTARNHGAFVSDGGDPHSLVGMPCG